MRLRSATAFCLLPLLAGALVALSAEGSGGARKEETPVKITVVYDNRAGAEGLDSAWGFSCLVEGLSDTILFDTGGDGPTLLRNMSKLGIEPATIDAVVLSHVHDDHTGGLSGFLEVRGDVRVYAPESFYSGIDAAARVWGARAIEVGGPLEICQGVLVTGDVSRPNEISEQCLVLSGDAGVAVVTGCAHPGIVNIVERVKAMTGRDVLLVIGGFHLLRASDRAVQAIISDLKTLGVRYAVPCHCTGDEAIERFAASYGEGFTRCAVGTVISAGDLLVAAAQGSGPPE